MNEWLLYLPVLVGILAIVVGIRTLYILRKKEKSIQTKKPITCGITNCPNKPELEVEGRVLLCRTCAETTDTDNWR